MPAPVPQQSVEQAARIIRQGGIVLYPSDTVYGLGCDPFNPAALRQLFRIKGRPEERPVLVLIPDDSYLEAVCETLSENVQEALAQLWPGPVTALLPARRDLPAPLVGEAGRVGVRRPASEYLVRWMKSIPGPLVSTSANLSGRAPSRSLRELIDLFGPRVDLVIEGEEPCPMPPSTVVDLAGDAPSIVREGAGVEQVRRLLARSLR